MDINEFKVLYARGDLDNCRLVPAHNQPKKWVIQADILSSGQVVTLTITTKGTIRTFGEQGILKAAEHCRIIGFTNITIVMPDMPKRERVRTEPITDEFLLNPPRQEENKTQSLF